MNRREFLKGTAAAGAAAVLPLSILPEFKQGKPKPPKEFYPKRNFWVYMNYRDGTICEHLWSEKKERFYHYFLPQTKKLGGIVEVWAHPLALDDFFIIPGWYADGVYEGPQSFPADADGVVAKRKFGNDWAKLRASQNLLTARTGDPSLVDAIHFICRKGTVCFCLDYKPKPDCFVDVVEETAQILDLSCHGCSDRHARIPIDAEHLCKERLPIVDLDTGQANSCSWRWPRSACEATHHPKVLNADEVFASAQDLGNKIHRGAGIEETEAWITRENAFPHNRIETCGGLGWIEQGRCWGRVWISRSDYCVLVQSFWGMMKHPSKGIYSNYMVEKCIVEQWET